MICYLHAQEKDIPAIVDKTVLGDEVIDRLLYLDEDTGKRVRKAEEIPFYKHQKRVLLENNVLIDATSILDYIAVGGYSALAKALTQMTPEEVLQEVKRANLRGRGGAGFPAGAKWETTRNAPGVPKYVVVNGDEGDPGAYMDRSLLEGNPHSVLEGLIIGAYAIGAPEGYHVRAPGVSAGAQARAEGHRPGARIRLAGREYLSARASTFDVKIHRGAGAFVSGESTALMNAIEGHVGEPRPKYIHTSEKGLWGKPTCLNNVETWANVPFIVNRGAEWFRSMGTEGSKGTKIFSLVGKVRNSGLVEVPMGMTLRDIVFKIGGGMPKGKKFKGVQTGGPSGGVLPESLLDLPVDFDELDKVGSMMGSGGMIVMDEDTCMVDTARYYVNFLAHESCGKCVPCREGLRQMLTILDRIAAGEGREGDIELLEELSEFMEHGFALRAGQKRAQSGAQHDPLLPRTSTKLTSARSAARREPARRLSNTRSTTTKCSHPPCGACARACAVEAIQKVDGGAYVILQDKCIKCGSCFTACPDKFHAVRKMPVAPVSVADPQCRTSSRKSEPKTRGLYATGNAGNQW